ncbi:hypothetical protein GGI20_001922 [Coemansia sp. BCRC 34301]|nr:hypothetical protein GGI20_001922 [Coemansia sp. BCRC 34301]
MDDVENSGYVYYMIHSNDGFKCTFKMTREKAVEHENSLAVEAVNTLGEPSQLNKDGRLIGYTSGDRSNISDQCLFVVNADLTSKTKEELIRLTKQFYILAAETRVYTFE